MFEMCLTKAIRDFLSYFSNRVSEFPLTYRSEPIDEASMRIQYYSVSGARREIEYTGPRRRCFISTNPITQPLHALPTGPV
jgi:hypothetical protein